MIMIINNISSEKVASVNTEININDSEIVSHDNTMVARKPKPGAKRGKARPRRPKR
jgi:hypothetical protein